MRFKQVSLLFFIVFVFNLSGCELLEKAEEVHLFTEVTKNMEEMRNYRMNMTYEIAASDFEMGVDMDMDIDLETEKIGKIAMDMDMELSMLGMAFNETQKSYIALEDDTVITYTEDSSTGQWYKETSNPSLFFSTNGDFSENFEDAIKLLEDETKIEFSENRTLNDGTEVEVYEVTISDFSMIEDLLGEDLEGTDIDFNQLEDIVYVLSIDPSEKVLRQIDIDLKTAFDSLDETTTETIDFTKAQVSISFSKFNEVGVTIPTDVINDSIEGELE